MRWLATVLLVICAVVGPGRAAAAAPSSPEGAAGIGDFAARAAQAYDQGDFTAAAAAYESAVQAGIVNGHLYYNLGICYFRMGRIGDAMAAFLGARRYLPRDPDVAANLRTVLGGIHDKLDVELPKGAALKAAFWIDRLTVKEWAFTTSLLAALCGIFLALAVVVPSLRHLRLAAILAFVVPLGAGLSLATRSGEDDAWGAVTDKEAKVYSGPSTKHPVVFELQEGAPALVTETVAGGFTRIELSDGKKGWIEGRQFKMFGPL